MTLTQEERDRIRAEEIERLQVRKDMKRQRRGQVLPVTIIWTCILIALAEMAHFQRGW